MLSALISTQGLIRRLQGGIVAFHNGLRVKRHVRSGSEVAPNSRPDGQPSPRRPEPQSSLLSGPGQVRAVCKSADDCGINAPPIPSRAPGRPSCLLPVLSLLIGVTFLPVIVQAQGAGLYKDGRKVLDFGEMASPTSAELQALAPAKGAKGRQLRAQVLGTESVDQFGAQNAYFHDVLGCRDLVRQITSTGSAGAVSRADIESLGALRERLAQSNQLLLAKFEEIGSGLRNSGCPADKLERHARMIERHSAAAKNLLEILARLGVADGTGNQPALGKALDELSRYFEDNTFQHDPPQLNAHPSPARMSVANAPVVQRGAAEAALSIPYPLVSGGAGYDPADLQPTIDVQFTDEIVALASELGHSAPRIYEYVHNNFTFEPYLGSRKGSQQTLDHNKGSDYDQASLLIALLRVSGIPARYATGTIEMPIDRATNWLGIDDPVNAGSILTTAGMEGVLVYMGPDPVAIRCKRVWVETWVPFVNYRGAVNDSTGFAWVPVDPTFKQYSYKPGINLPAEIGFNFEAFVEEYYSTFHSETPIEMFKRVLADSASKYHPGSTYDDLIRTRSVIEENDGILPGTLPYELLSFDGTFSAILTSKRYYVGFHLYDGWGMDLNYTTSLPEIVRKQVTLSYVGATPADQAIIDAAGGIFNVTTPWLVDLKPVLKIDGCEVARGSGAVVMGTTHYSDMQFTAPVGAQNQMPVVSNTIIAGNYQGIGLDTEDALPSLVGAPQTTCPENQLGQESHQLTLTYLHSVDAADDEIADLMHLVVMNDVSEAIVENTVTVLFNGGGDPVTMNWTGMIVDADRNIVGPFSVDGLDNDCDFMRLGGADGSIQENRLFEVRFDEEAVSAIKILELASDSGIPVCKITYSIAVECPGFNHPSSVWDAVNFALSQGHHVIIPQRDFTYYEWTGTGWIDIDPATCAAGYIISGGHNGGSTVQVWLIPWYLWFADIRCTKASGTVTVSPPGDYYCSESWDFWTFHVPQIDYYSKNKDGTCFVKASAPRDFHVMFPIRVIAWLWGPGKYTFSAGGPGECPACAGAEKEVTIVRVELKSLEFTSDHEDAAGGNILKKSRGGKYANVGDAYEEPEWNSTGRNNPITQSKGTILSIKATVKAEPAGIPFTIVGNGPSDYLDFACTPLTSTGIDQEVAMDARTTLPNAVCYLNDQITWKATLDEGRIECALGSTGSHEIFVTLDKPIETGSYYPTNRLTYMRVKVMCETAAKDADNPDAAAASMHKWVADKITFSEDPPDAWDESAIWGLVNKEGNGQCHQGANLMDFGMHLIGVKSQYRHIKASARLPVLFTASSSDGDRKEQRPDATRNPAIPPCPHGHGAETLWMWLGGLNHGEGSCRVGAKVYPAFVPSVVGVDEGTRTAEHDILILFKGRYGEDFQRWYKQDVPCGDWEPVPPVP